MSWAGFRGHPNAEDEAGAAKRGVAPGGLIMIHGQPPLMPLRNTLVGVLLEAAIVQAAQNNSGGLQ